MVGLGEDGTGERTSGNVPLEKTLDSDGQLKIVDRLMDELDVIRTSTNRSFHRHHHRR